MVMVGGTGTRLRVSVVAQAAGLTRRTAPETTVRRAMSHCSLWRKTSPPAYPRSYHVVWASPTSQCGRPHAPSFQPARIAAFRPGVTWWL